MTNLVKTGRILNDVSKPSYSELEAKIAAMEAKLAEKRKITLKVSAKGGLSLYGLGRWPVTLYSSQWKALLGQSENIEKFLSDHASELATKVDE